MKLGKMLAAYRAENKISIRKMAKEIGVETTSLFRFERGRSVSNDKWVAIMVWCLGEKKS